MKANSVVNPCTVLVQSAGAHLGEIRRCNKECGLKMEDEEEDENSSDLEIKRKKTCSFFENNSQTHYRRNIKPKRSLPLSLKSTRFKKKAGGSNNIKTFFESRNKTLDGTDKLKFCPVCQLPFRTLIGVSIQGHVQECVTNYLEPSGMVTINCSWGRAGHDTRTTVYGIRLGMIPESKCRE